jgi:hypothetical protein
MSELHAVSQLEGPRQSYDLSELLAYASRLVELWDTWLGIPSYTCSSA